MPTSERRLAQVSIGAKQARYRAWQSLLSLPLAGQGLGYSQESEKIPVQSV
jgi:hypothetical protein